MSAQAALLEVAAGTLIGLVAFGLVAGIGITAVGPGGVLVTVGLFVLTDLSPAAVAGTAIVTHVATAPITSPVVGLRDSSVPAVVPACVALSIDSS